MSEVHTWAVAADDNDSAPPNGAPEGMAASAVNNVIREVMAALARKAADENGTLTTAGTSTAYTVAAPNQTFASLSNGLKLKLRLHTANGANPTLNVNSLGAVALRSPMSTSSGLGATQYAAGSIIEVVYRSSYGSAGAGWFIQSGGIDAHGARRTVSTYVGSGAVGMNQTYLFGSASQVITLPSAADYAVGDEVELLALASPSSFTIAPIGSDVIYWSDFATSTGSATPRGFGGATTNYRRACRIRKVAADTWYGFVYSSFLS